MKKILLLIIPLLLLGCSNSKPFYLDSEFYNSNERIDINSEDFTTYVDDKKSFAILVYTEGCISCINFSKHLDDFQNKYNIKFYKISAGEMKKTSLSKFIKYSPSVVIYNNGKMVDYLDAESDDDIEYYESVDGFYKWFTKYVILNNDTTNNK